MKPSVDQTALLRQHGVQVTAQRLDVLCAVSDRPHRTAADIDMAVRAEIGAISPQAVYDPPWGPSPTRESSGASSPLGRRLATRTESATAITISSAESAAGWSMSTVPSVTPPA